MTVEQLEAKIGERRTFVGRRPGVDPGDVEELESHLRDQIADLGEAGLMSDEAFLIAVKRLGSLDDVSREFAREHTGRLWKLLVNLAGTAWLSARFLTRRSSFYQLERWQTSYLPFFGVWAATVVVVLPPAFSFG